MTDDFRVVSTRTIDEGLVVAHEAGSERAVSLSEAQREARRTEKRVKRQKAAEDRRIKAERRRIEQKRRKAKRRDKRG